MMSDMSTSVDPGAGPVLTVPDVPPAFHLLPKPTGAVCNLDGGDAT